MEDISLRFPEFAARMRAMLTEEDYKAYLHACTLPPLRYARINPRKPVSEDLLRAELGDFPLLPEGAKPGSGALHAAGAYYVQEPAAAACAGILPPLLPEGARVLDMCAAPGGKVTAAACARDDCLFVANEISFHRAKILLSNIERMGLRNVTVTSLRPDEIARRVPGSFDAVIADVPCSGEGMLRKAEFGSEDLSDAAVQACAARARKILESADLCLKTGGLLAFSTCTFNRTENEAQVRYLIDAYGYEPVPVPRPPHSRASEEFPEAVRFFPQDGGGEGHFFCLLRKTGVGATARLSSCVRPAPRGKARDVAAMLSGITDEEFRPEYMLEAGDGYEYCVSDEVPYALPALRRGVRLATSTGGNRQPHHHFATSADPSLLLAPLDFSPGSPQIAAFLRGESFACDGARGYRVLCVASLPLGLVKVSDGQAKNHYPRGLRLRT